MTNLKLGSDRPLRFAMLGLGYISPQHLHAIKHLGGQLVTAHNPSTNVGHIQRIGLRGCLYKRKFEVFLEVLDDLRRAGNPVDYLVVATPNYLHATHAKIGLSHGADVICEKPLTLHTWTLDELVDHEQRTGRRVWTVLQTRLHPEIIALQPQTASGHYDVALDWATERDEWYFESWKNNEHESGGLIMNIGIHFLDVLLFLFGSCHSLIVTQRDERVVAGSMILDRADVAWRLSIAVGETQRQLTIDGRPIDITSGFENLHLACYQEILAGRGFGIAEARPSIELAWMIRSAMVGQVVELSR